jgi:hypothetical protein
MTTVGSGQAQRVHRGSCSVPQRGSGFSGIRRGASVAPIVTLSIASPFPTLMSLPPTAMAEHCFRNCGDVIPDGFEFLRFRVDSLHSRLDHPSTLGGVCVPS